MAEFLFAYGTLRPGMAPPDVAPLVDRMQPAGEAFVSGVLYDFGHFPGALLDRNSGSRIYGTVFRLPEEGGLLPLIDAYEEFEPDCPEASLFLRVTGVASLSGGESLTCWIYVYNRQIGPAPIIEDGRWPQRRSPE